MNSGNWQKVNELFLAALERRPADRPAFLDSACGGDPALRAEVERLLRSDSQAGSFLEDAVLSGVNELSKEIGGPMIGSRVGPYI